MIKRIPVILCMLLCMLFNTSCYNAMVSGQEKVEEAAANVDAMYQRRADLVPQLVSVVKGYAKHEKETFDAVIKARNAVQGMTLDPNNMTEEQLAKYQAQQAALGNAMNRVFALAEAYPELKSNENFKDLQSQLEGTENRVAKARTDFNNAVREYNTTVRSFPNNIFAGMFGFQPRVGFKADPGAEKAPTVSFDDL